MIEALDTSLPKLDEFLEFLEERCVVLVNLDKSYSRFNTKFKINFSIFTQKSIILILVEI